MVFILLKPSPEESALYIIDSENLNRLRCILDGRSKGSAVISIQAQLFPELYAAMFEVKVEKERSSCWCAARWWNRNIPESTNFGSGRRRASQFLNLIGKAEEKRKGSGKRKR